MLRLIAVSVLMLLAGLLREAVAQPSFVQASVGAEEREPEIFYVIKRQATVFTAPDSARAYLQLSFREPVFVRETKGRWSYVQTQEGASGYLSTEAISNVWVRVSKRQKSVFVYQGLDLLKKIPADFGYNAYADKEQRGSTANPDDWRTPEGMFFVVKKNPYSQFHKAFVLNYPTSEDAERGYQKGLISRDEYEAIVQAEQAFEMPPMTTSLGGMIEIHGNGSGYSTNWTRGCIAIRDDQMDELWKWVQVGTPVLVEY